MRHSGRASASTTRRARAASSSNQRRRCASAALRRVRRSGGRRRAAAAPRPAGPAAGPRGRGPAARRAHRRCARRPARARPRPTGPTRGPTAVVERALGEPLGHARSAASRATVTRELGPTASRGALGAEALDVVAGVGLVRDEPREPAGGGPRPGVDLHDRAVAAAVGVQGAPRGVVDDAVLDRLVRRQSVAARPSAPAARPQRPDGGAEPVGRNGVAPRGGPPSARRAAPCRAAGRRARGAPPGRRRARRGRRDVEAPAHLARERHVLAGEPARPPLDGPQLAGEEALAPGVQPGVGQRGREPAGLPDELRRGRQRLGGDRPTQHGVHRPGVDERGNQPAQPQAQARRTPPARSRSASPTPPYARTRGDGADHAECARETLRPRAGENDVTQSAGHVRRRSAFRRRRVRPKGGITGRQVIDSPDGGTQFVTRSPHR